MSEPSSAPVSEVGWTPEALQRMERAPLFLRGMVKRLAEKKARELGYSEITADILDQFKSQMMGEWAELLEWLRPLMIWLKAICRGPRLHGNG